MGIVQAGLAFSLAEPAADLGALVARLTGETPVAIHRPNWGDFDIRRPGDVMVQVFGNACFVCNGKIAAPLMEHPERDATASYEALGRPDFFMAFYCLDSGGTYGYALFEHGVRVRSRLQSDAGPPHQPPLVEFGTPTELEQQWLGAVWRLEEDENAPPEEWVKLFIHGSHPLPVPEFGLTSRMLYEICMQRFGVCPWDTQQQGQTHLFKLPPPALPLKQRLLQLGRSLRLAIGR